MLKYYVPTIIMFHLPVFIIPGPNLVIVARNTLISGFYVGLYTVLGLTLGISFHVLYSLIVVLLLSQEFLDHFIYLKYLASAYLTYLSYKLVSNSKNFENFDIRSLVNESSAFKTGACIDLFNPFIGIFYAILWSLLLQTDVHFTLIAISFITILLVVLLWFVLVCYIFSINNLREIYLKNIRKMEITVAILMLFFSCCLLFL